MDYGPRGDCNPIDPGHCLLPYPSAFFLEAEPGSATGVRVRFGAQSLPADTEGVPWDPQRWNLKDGFPVLGSLYAHFPGADLTGVTGLDDLEAFAATEATTLIVRADTGERLPHFVEHDMDSAGTDRQLLILRPVRPMAHGQRYVVGVRGLRRAADGALFDAPAGFASVRDGGARTLDLDLERQRRRYEDEVFPILEAAGASKAALQLAWDFTTVSEDNTVATAKFLRDDALRRGGDEGAPYVIEEIFEDDCAADGVRIGRTVHLTVSSPRYVEPGAPGGVFVLSEDGLPMHQGDRAIGMDVRIPCSLLGDPRARPGRLVQYGHGLLGGRDEVEDGYLGRMADRHGWILFATDWTGMAFDDAVSLINMLQNDRSEFPVVPDRLQQGFAEATVAAHLIQRGALADDPALRADDGDALVDPTTLWFYGNSQGAVVGGAYVALSRDIERAALGVGGAPFMFLATRATGFEAFRAVLGAVYDDPASAALSLALMQMLWDPGESAGWAHAMDKPVLLQAAIGDRSVTTFGAHVLARAWGAALLTPAPRPVWGLDPRAAPHEGTTLVEMDWGVPDMEVAYAEFHEVHTHDLLRQRREAQDQVAEFLETGRAHHYCQGPCRFSP